MGSFQVLSAVQATFEPFAVPVMSFRASRERLLAPAPWFQWVPATTPAVSVAAIAVPVPTKLIATVFAPELVLVTTKVTVVEFTRVPLVPVTVRVEEAIGVDVVVVTVNVEPPDVDTVVGENAAVAPVGRPEALKVTVPVKPFTAAIVAV